MVRLLLHSADATYDSSEKSYTFSLDRRIDRPTKLRVVKAHYSAATADEHPLVVYLRSNALSSLIRSKHTLQLKNAQHEQPTNILCTLNETHAQARYSMEKDARIFQTDPHQILKEIDIRWSDNDTLLEQGAAAGGGGGVAATGTEAEIEALGTKVRAWFDLHPSRTLKANFSESPNTVGELLHYLYSRSPSPANLILDANWDMERYQLGNAIGISRDSSATAGHGMVLLDSSNPITSFGDQEFHLHTVIRAPGSYNDTSGVFRLGWDYCRLQLGTNGVLKYIDLNDSTQELQNIVWIPNKIYLLSLSRKLDANNDPKFHWRFEDASAGTVQTEITSPGMAFTDTAQGPWSLGVSGLYLRITIGAFLVVSGSVASEFETCRQYINNWYNGVATAPAEEGNDPVPTSATAKWFVELDIEQQ